MSAVGRWSVSVLAAAGIALFSATSIGDPTGTMTAGLGQTAAGTGAGTGTGTGAGTGAGTGTGAGAGTGTGTGVGTGTGAAAGTPVAKGALPPSVPGNLELKADLLEVDTKGQTATLTGNVELGKGDLSLKCPKIEVRYDASGPRVSWAKGSGGVIADVKGIKGEAPEFELDLVKQKLALRGGVRLYRGQGWVVADGAEIDLATARLTMTNVKASLPVGGALKKP
jgi:lipopolysaccharide transport protein LptA